jgi:hypothetical protein
MTGGNLGLGGPIGKSKSCDDWLFPCVWEQFDISVLANRQAYSVVTQQTINNESYNYSPNYSIFPEVIRDTLVSHDLGAKVVTFAYVRWGPVISSLET